MANHIGLEAEEVLDGAVLVVDEALNIGIKVAEEGTVRAWPQWSRALDVASIEWPQN